MRVFWKLGKIIYIKFVKFVLEKCKKDRKICVKKLLKFECHLFFALDVRAKFPSSSKRRWKMEIIGKRRGKCVEIWREDNNNKYEDGHPATTTHRAKVEEGNVVWWHTSMSVSKVIPMGGVKGCMGSGRANAVPVPVAVILAQEPCFEGGLHFGRRLGHSSLEHFNGRFPDPVIE